MVDYIHEQGVQQLASTLLDHIENVRFDEVSSPLIALQVLLHRSILNLVDINKLHKAVLHIDPLLHIELSLHLLDFCHVAEGDDAASLKDSLGREYIFLLT